MTTLYNEITINAPIEAIWAALSSIEQLDRFDPTVKKSTALTQSTSGVGAKRKVDMRDGKNWFEERCTVCEHHTALGYELTACSFPVHQLQHSYSFEKLGKQIRVKQVMKYNIKFGIFGRILDMMMIRRQTENGIKKFFAGLKSYTENN